MRVDEKSRFTRYETNIVKGFAILAMVLHHVCPNNTALSVTAWKVVDLQTILGSSGKVCVAPFALGIYLSNKSVLDRLMRFEGLWWGVASVMLFTVALVLRLFWTLQFDPVLALACIPFSIFVLRRINGVESLLSRLGALSAGIWLLHLFMRHIIARLSFTTYYGRAALLIFLTIGVVMVIDEIKESLRYNDLVRKVRRFIEIGRPPPVGRRWRCGSDADDSHRMKVAHAILKEGRRS